MSHRYEGPKARPPRRTLDHTIQEIVKISRDLGLLILGGYGFVYELTREGAERPYILVATMAMLGLPGIIRLDAQRQEAKKNNDGQQEGSQNGAASS